MKICYSIYFTSRNPVPVRINAATFCGDYCNVVTALQVKGKAFKHPYHINPSGSLYVRVWGRSSGEQVLKLQCPNFGYRAAAAYSFRGAHYVLAGILV